MVGGALTPLILTIKLVPPAIAVTVLNWKLMRLLRVSMVHEVAAEYVDPALVLYEQERDATLVTSPLV